MVENLGEATAYSTGTTHRPLPPIDLTRRSTIPRCGECDRAISAHDATVDGLCRRCRHPEAPAPAAAGKAETYPEYDADEIARRFAPDDTRLGQELGQLAAENPAVAAASDRLDDMVARVTRPDDRPSASNEGAKRATVRAKVTATKPGPGVLIALTGPITAPQVAALLTDLLAALQQGPINAAPAGRKGKAAAGAARPKKPSKSKLAPHHDDILAAYAEGQTPYEIGRHYSTTDVAVRNYLQAAGVRLRTRREAQLIRRPRTTTTSTGATA